MKVNKILIIGILVSCQFMVMSQTSRLSYGFKAGLNSSVLNGDVDPGESYESVVGFHLGIIFKYAITDLFGVKGEFMYSQKGTKYLYDGPSSFYVQRTSGPFLVNGTRKMSLTSSNDYLDFPIMLYGKFGRFELSGGFNVGLLAGSTAGGQMTFTGTEPATSAVTLNLDYRYTADEAREVTPPATTLLVVGSDEIALAQNVGAYYEYDEKGGNYYGFLDFGLNAGLSVFLNEGLYLGLRANIGLSDVTNPDADITFKPFEGSAPVLQNDKNTQTSYQFSLGFSF